MRLGPCPGWLTLQASREDDVVETQTCLDFLKSYWDPAQPCHVRFHTIVCAKIELEDGFMLPKYVDVRLEPIEPHCFWRGSAQEFAPRIAKHRKRKPSDKGARRVAPRTGRPSGHPTGPTIDPPGPSDADDDAVPGVEHQGSDIDMDMPETDAEDVVESLCRENDEGSESERDDDDGVEEPISDLIDEFFANAQENDLLDEDGPPAPPPEGLLLPPVHPSEELSGPRTKTDPDSSSSSSSSSSTSSSSSSRSRRRANRHVPTLGEAGAPSASAQASSTVTIGPLKIVKRFHPVPRP